MMRFSLFALFLLLPLTASAEKRVMGLTETDRQEMRLCTSLKDYEVAVRQVAKLSAESTAADVDFALERVDEEWRDVEHDADEYKQVQTTQLARSADQLQKALEDVGDRAKPEVIQSHAGPVAKETLRQVGALETQVECSKPVAGF